ncbi:Rhomboid family protein [Mesonia phycicola]|uniref:Rhomboid family protein n=1 Tax=Mesonia phycicola TaxID=579105 RepID=A0A1M6FLM3_9FLAO|nr:rhomboid family intramembrane serine protease [Mesonia phycicola]SHI98529.1 Rhomboid family protein [Mesonia phycicola]
MGRITETVKVLLIANILFFVGSQISGDYTLKILALWFPENDNFGVWQLVTHMFMHGGVSHIVFNMFALYMFGSVLEQAIGKNRFIFLYFSSGLAAAGLQILFSYLDFNPGFQACIDAGIDPATVYQSLEKAVQTNQYQFFSGVSQEMVVQMTDAYVTPMVGASGAIFGVLAAFAVVYPNLPLYIMFIPIPIKAKYLIGGYFLLNVYSAVTGMTLLGPSNTAYWAHIGGAVIGFVTMWYWQKNQFNQNRWN